MKPSGIRRLFRFPSKSVREVRDDVRDEVRFHLEMRTRDLEAEGLDAGAAREQALREFGDVRRASDTLVKLDGRVNRQQGLSRLAAELRQDVSVRAAPDWPKQRLLRNGHRDARAGYRR